MVLGRVVRDAKPVIVDEPGLSSGLAKLRRSTELACAYPDVTIVRAEAHAILAYIEELELEVAHCG